MPNDVGSSRPPQIPGYPRRSKRRRFSALAKLVGVLVVLAILGGLILGVPGLRHFFVPSRGVDLLLKHSAPVPEFTAFKTLDDFVDMECFYTDKFAEPLLVAGDTSQIKLLPRSRVVVKKVTHQDADYDHPMSRGYKLFVLTQDASAMPHVDAPDQSAAPVSILNTLLVLYPVMDNHDAIAEVQLCPVSALEKARDLWLGKKFKYNAGSIGAVEIEAGSIVTVTDVEPASFKSSGMSFELTFKLPSGATQSQTTSGGYFMDVLQPLNP